MPSVAQSYYGEIAASKFLGLAGSVLRLKRSSLKSKPGQAEYLKQAWKKA
jgi:hypothetical protein